MAVVNWRRQVKSSKSGEDRHALDRERKRLVTERERRMHGNRRQQHVDNGLRRAIERARERLDRSN